jgi:hypothetical protein
MSNSFPAAFASLRRIRFIQALVFAVSLSVSSSATPAIAGQFSNGASVFDHAPRLMSVSTTQPIAIAAGGTYEFKLTVPQDAGAPLQAVTISQAENAAKIQFRANQSQAVANGAPLTISAIGGAESDNLTISFDQPVQPGSTVTISLPVARNADTGGIYLFGVTAYPVGDSTNGLFLGYGRVVLFSQRG